jgi:hypothetical protein
MWKSISESGFGQHVGGHKLAYGAVAAATVGAMAWHMGSKHRENAINAQVASPRLR